MGYTRFLAKKAIFLVLTLLAALYATVVIANFGGFLDTILAAQTRFEVSQELSRNPAFLRLPPDEQNETFNRTLSIALEARGLNQDFITKSVRFTWELLQFRLGRATVIRSAAGSADVGEIIWERLPRTVLLFTTGAILSALVGIWLGLRMARKALSPMDRGLTVFSITTAVVPSWVFGILFILAFAFFIPIFPPGGMVSVPAKTDPFEYTLDVLYHMALPLFTITLSLFGSWSYTTRNLVLQIMDEDYVYAARSKGLPEKTVLNRYVLRAASPPTVTALALTIIASWQGAIVTETVFNWPGLGLLYFNAIINLDAPVVIGLTAIYAYLLVLTVFILDLIYGLLDPRVKAMRG